MAPKNKRGKQKAGKAGKVEQHSSDKNGMSTDDFLKEGLDSGSEQDMEDAASEEEVEVTGPKKHKQSLEKLKQSDPEFYEFLKNEDQELLDFSSDSGDDEGDEEEGGVHKLPSKLEVASDEEDDEDSETEEAKLPGKKSGKQVKVTMKMVEHWSQLLRDKKSVIGLQESVEAFKAVVLQNNPNIEGTSKYKVVGNAVFNAVIRVCMADMPIMLAAVLKLPKSKDPNKPVLPSTCANWGKVKVAVKSYLPHLIHMMTDLTEPAILNVTLKHVYMMILYFASFPKTSKILLKKLVNIWSKGEETSRVLAFMSINKLARSHQLRNMDTILKSMYMDYVKNCKFTSPTALPMINFMQRSLVEMLALDLHLTYQYAFVYIRQLAINLRNAITTKKKETCQAVYNWQYIHSLGLWTRMLSTLYPCDTLQPLIYPLTQTIIGTIKLLPSAKYYPLRFHCVRLLNMLSASTNTYIPTLPFLTEVFQITNFNKRHKHLGFKPVDYSCVLKLSEKQLEEKSFRDTLVEQMYEHLLETVQLHAHTISFPELTFPLVLQLKEFLKTCKVANYTKQMKQILDKVQETSKIITQRRRTASLNLQDAKAINAWELRSKEEGTPLGKYYATYRKLRDKELQHEIASKDRISSEGMPRIERNLAPRQATEEDRKEFGELFDTDSEDEDDNERFLLKEERPSKKKKVEKESDSDEYSDFDDEELERLAQSASEDDEEDEEDVEDDDEEGEEENEDEDADEDNSDAQNDEAAEDAEMDDEESDDDDDVDKDDIVKDFDMSDLDSD